MIQDIIDGMSGGIRPSDYWTRGDSRFLFTELEASKYTQQKNNQSVWDHTMSVIDLLETKNPITLLAGLFHDLGKSYVKCNDFRPKFPGHEEASAHLAKLRLKQWQASQSIIDRVSRLITTHMYDIKNIIHEKAIRKFLADVGSENIDNWFCLRIADSKSYQRHRRYKKQIINPFRIRVDLYLSESSECDDIQLIPAEPLTVISGKSSEDKNISLSTEGSE